MKVRVIAITGSRDWTDEDAINEVIQMERVGPATLVVMHGDCPTGADAIAEKLCAKCGIHTLRVAARWLVFGKNAGPYRNNIMAALKPKRCYAFPLPHSRGTYDCINAMDLEGVNCLEVTRAGQSTGSENIPPVGGKAENPNSQYPTSTTGGSNERNAS